MKKTRKMISKGGRDRGSFQLKTKKIQRKTHRKSGDWPLILEPKIQSGKTRGKSNTLRVATQGQREGEEGKGRKFLADHERKRRVDGQARNKRERAKLFGLKKKRKKSVVDTHTGKRQVRSADQRKRKKGGGEIGGLQYMDIAQMRTRSFGKLKASDGGGPGGGNST